MRDYGKISTSIWNSRKFASIGDSDRLLYLYLHTCPHVNSVGCFVLKSGYATADMGWSEEAYRKGIETLSDAGLIGFEASENLIRLVNFARFDPFTNVNHAKGAIKIALALPDCDQKLLLLKDISALKFASNDADIRSAIESLSKGYRTPEPEPEPEPEPDKEKEMSDFALDQVPAERPRDIGPAFEEFWNVWPNKNSKQDAGKAWSKLSAQDRRAAMSAIRDGWFDKWQRANTGASPILPASFLRGGRWSDEFTPTGGDPGKPKIGEKREHPQTGAIQEYAGGLEGWMTVHQ